MSQTSLPYLGLIAPLEKASSGSDGTLAAFRAHLTRWEQKRDHPRTEYHRGLAETKVAYYKRVIEALMAGRQPPPKPRFKARTRTWHVYRHFDEDENLLYIGKTGDWLDRNASHRRQAPWYDEVVKITIARFATSEAMNKAEKKAIADEEPLYNLLLQRSNSDDHSLFDLMR